MERFESLAAAVAQHAATDPDRLALIALGDGDGEVGRITFGELHRRASVVAARLRRQAAPGDRALLMLPTSIEYVEGFLGCLHAGVLAIPVYAPTTTMHADRLRRVIDDADATCVITTEKVHATVVSRYAGALGDKRFSLLDAPETGEVGGDAVVPNPEAVAYLQYTSGSTGSPRGVMVKHGNLHAHVRSFVRRYGQGRSEAVVSWLPLFHDMGLVLGVVHPLYVGSTAVLMSPAAFLQRPARWVEALSRYRGVFTQAPNFAYELCAERATDAEIAQLDLSSLRVAINGAEPVRASTLRRFADRFAPCGLRPEALSPGYGMAETTLGVSASISGWKVASIDPAALQADRLVARTGEGARELAGSGALFDGVDVRIVDPATGRPCADGRVGEVWVRGDIVTAGYWRRPEETAATFGARLPDGSGPFLRTGDLGAMEDGELYLTGRMKDVIIVRGRNFYPQDLEQSAFAAHPALSPGRGAAFSVEQDGRERVVVALEVRRTERRRMNGEEVARVVRAAIASAHGVDVDAVVLLPPASIQMTSSGKIQRRACMQAYLAGTLEPLFVWKAEVPAAPAGPAATSANQAALGREEIAARIRAWIAEKKRVPAAQVTLATPFSELGLDSVEVVELSAALSTWLSRPVEPDALFNHPDVQRLAAFLSGEEPAAQGDRAAARGEPADEGVAIVGMACRFPGSPSLERYWRTLEDGVDAIREVPPERWSVERYYAAGERQPGKMTTRWGGFIDDVDLFDAGFFGISPREAESMDPQQRVLLGVVWHALEDAGIPPPGLAGSRTGVFVGISSADYRRVQWGCGAGLDAYAGTGGALSIAANRVSYFLDLRGPSWAVDTACSSSLVALHQARRSLLDGECDLAIVAGVNLTLAPDLTVVFSQAQMMSPTGRCRTFDAAADGYVRGEGCGVVVLKRTQEALRDGDRIAAVVAGSAVNQDGRSNGLTAPNGLAQEAVIRAALESARIAAGAVSYVEAHGTGTPLGDPIELHALEAVYGERSATAPTLWVGAVKTNVGHLEAAAGMAGLIKVALALQHGRIPPTLHLRDVNPAIRLDGSRCAIARRTVPWAASGAPRAAGVSSFGFGGTNAHVIVREAPSVPEAAASGLPGRETELLTLSAKTPAALRGLAERFVGFLGEPPAPWGQVCRASRVHRTHFPQRLAVVARSGADAARELARHLRDEPTDGVITAGPSSVAEPVGFLFTGQGSQYVGMGERLYRSSAAFRRALDECDALARPALGRSLLDAMFSPASSDLDETAVAQPALFALEWALSAVLRSAGLTPSLLIGHSLGEYVAACVAEVFSLEEGLRLVIQRGHLMQARSAQGAMCAITAPAQVVERLLAAPGEHLPPRVDVAAHNGPAELVLSGDPAELRAAVEALAREGAKGTFLKVKRAFHSPLMDGILEEFAAVAAEVRFRAPKIPIVSNLTGAIIGEEIASADYWVRHVRQRVRFAPGVAAMGAAGCRTFVEIGPHPVLTALGMGMVPGAQWIPTLRRSADDEAQLQRCLGAWYASGRAVDWRRVESDWSGAERPGAHVALPAYPFDGERYWVREEGGAVDSGQARGEASTRRAPPRGGGAGAAEPLVGDRLDLPGLDEQRFEARLELARMPALGDHRVFGRAVLPAAGTLVALRGAALRGGSGTAACALEAVTLVRPVIIPEDGPVFTHLCLSPNGEVRGFTAGADGEWVEHATCSSGQVRPAPAPLDVAAATAGWERLEGDWYARFDQLGLGYRGSFRGLRAVWRRDDTIVAEVRAPDPGAPQMARLDACLHSLLAFVPAEAEASRVPSRIDRALWFGEIPEVAWVQARWRAGTGAEGPQADLTVFTAGGAPVLALEGLHLAEVRPEAFGVPERRAPAAYRLGWVPLVPAGDRPTRRAGTWVAFCPDAARAEVWQAECARAGIETITVIAAPAFCELGPGRIGLAPEKNDQLAQLGRLLKERYPQVAGLVWEAGRRDGAEPCAEVDRAYGAVRESFAFLRSFLEAGGETEPDMIVSTRGAHTLPGDTAGEELLAGRAVSALARAITAEFPRLRCVAVDLDPAGETPAAAELLDVAGAAGGCADLARRGGQWWVGEVAPHDLSAVTASPSIRPDASYLVTGGSGALGTGLARWLVDLGARSLVLASRRGAVDPALLRALEDVGARVRAVAVDVADPLACERMLAEIDATLPPLRGIFHAAGTLDDGAFGNLDWSRFERVLDPKVRGAWNLHALTAGRELDHFVLFSSVAALIGSPGQANYVVANAFLDGLAEVRRGRGLPALSVNWGPWAGGGMAAGGGRLERMEQVGLRGLEPAEAFSALGTLAAGARTPAAVGVLHVDWERFASARAGAVADRRLAGVSQGARSPADRTAAVQALLNVADLDAAQAKELIATDLLGRVARVLKLEPHRKEALAARFRSVPLNELGLDSLMAVDLRNRLLAELAVDVPIHHFIGGSTAGDVVDLVHQQLLMKRLVSGAERPPQDDADHEVFTL